MRSAVEFAATGWNRSVAPLLLFASAACLAAQPLPAETVLVRNGRPAAEIVIAETAPRSVRLAADELQHYVEKISGATLPIVNQPSPGNNTKVYVGRSEFADRSNLSDSIMIFENYPFTARGFYLPAFVARTTRTRCMDDVWA